MQLIHCDEEVELQMLCRTLSENYQLRPISNIRIKAMPDRDNLTTPDFVSKICGY